MRGSDDRIADAELIVSEAVGNAVRHTGGPVWVSLAWSTELPVLRVYDIGPGFDTDDLPAPATVAMAGGTLDEHGGDDLDDGVLLADSGRGLLIIQALAPEVSAAVRANAGMVVSATLPVPRRRTASLDPPRLRTNVLPSMDEVRPEGGFGKESFLRALVVQLSQAIETTHGPDAAEAAVAQVGVDVSWQEEVRQAEQVGPASCGSSTPSTAASRWSRPPERIVRRTPTARSAAVLRARRWPDDIGVSGDAAPHPVSVLLEERIAVGDPACRVVVSLVPVPEDEAPFAHLYRAPVGSTADLG